MAALRARVERLELQNRLEREKSTLLTVELDETKEELAELKARATETQSGMVAQPGRLVWRQRAAAADPP